MCGGPYSVWVPSQGVLPAVINEAIPRSRTNARSTRRRDSDCVLLADNQRLAGSGSPRLRWTIIRLPNLAGMIRWLGLGISALAGVFSSDTQGMPSQRDGNLMGDEGKAVDTCPSLGGFALYS